jgi:cob(I)alamin adenosyltransferase
MQWESQLQLSFLPRSDKTDMPQAQQSIATRTGDSGDTGLLYGGRVRKTDARVEAYGAGDEAVSALGLARALCKDERVKAEIHAIQSELFTINAELATAASSRHRLERHFPTAGPEMTARLDALLAELEAAVELPRSFIIPGGSAGSGAIDLARTIVRRTERAAVALLDSGEMANPEVPKYLNRLSDCLFMLARYEDRGLPPDAYKSQKGS